MKKQIIALLLCSISCSAFSITLEDKAKSGDAAAAYQLAELYEKNNNIKKAMYWYKQAAKPSLEKGNNIELTHNNPVIANDTLSVTQNQVNDNQQTTDSSDEEPIVSGRLTAYQKHDGNSKLLQSMDSTFGLRPYRSNYILPITYDTRSHADGRKHSETTFQISFQKDVVTDLFGLDETIGFAYTQRSWWQITESSSPFRETNYLPEIYVQFPNSDPNNILRGIQTGFVHESNGQGSKNGKSRSWNRLYLEGYFKFNNIYVVPRAWYKVYENRNHDDNHDIQDYLGYGDVNILLPYEKHLVKLLIRNNLNFNDNHGAIQADWTYPLGDTGLYGYIQYFYGYGESLIDYNKKTNRLGIGVALSR